MTFSFVNEYGHFGVGVTEWEVGTVGGFRFVNSPTRGKRVPKLDHREAIDLAGVGRVYTVGMWLYEDRLVDVGKDDADVVRMSEDLGHVVPVYMATRQAEQSFRGHAGFVAVSAYAGREWKKGDAKPLLGEIGCLLGVRVISATGRVWAETQNRVSMAK